MYESSNWGTWKGSNWYKNSDVDALLQEALRVAAQEKRQQLYEQAARLIVDDAASVWVFNTKWYGPFRKNVHGVRFCPIGNGLEIRWMHMT